MSIKKKWRQSSISTKGFGSGRYTELNGTGVSITLSETRSPPYPSREGNSIVGTLLRLIVEKRMLSEGHTGAQGR